MNTVVCIGDSLTRGKEWVADNPAKNITNRLSEKYPGIAFANLGVNGDKTQDVVNRLSTIDQYNPFRVIVWIGVNDIPNGVTEATIEANLTTIYNYVKTTRNAELWALTVSPRDDNTMAMMTIRENVNAWIKANASVDKVIDACTVVKDPNNPIARLPAYAANGSTAHLLDGAYAALMQYL